ncbi:MAG: hypothetical protein OHK0022_44070 [Roseiflexaceae bacterium]
MNTQELQRWLEERLPEELRAAPPEITLYDDELVVVLSGAGVVPAALPEDERRTAEERRIGELREESRPLRMRLARDLQAATGRPVAWGMRVGTSEELFTSRTVPVMTRLGRAERELLDTLVAAGVAETRSAALGYVVRAFAAEHGEWLAEMRAAITQMHAVRARLKLSRRSGPPKG